MHKCQGNIKIWQVNIKIWQDNIKIKQVNIIIWQVMAEKCHLMIEIQWGLDDSEPERLLNNPDSKNDR